MKDLNCIFCKHFNNKKGCEQIMILSMYGKTVWHCPTITNYYYGKMLDGDLTQIEYNEGGRKL